MSGQLVLYHAAQYTGESTGVLLTGRKLMQYHAYVNLCYLYEMRQLFLR